MVGQAGYEYGTLTVLKQEDSVLKYGSFTPKDSPENNLRALNVLEDLETLFKIFYTFVCKKVSGKLQTNIWKI